jgi:hypothetical protein
MASADSTRSHKAALELAVNLRKCRGWWALASWTSSTRFADRDPLEMRLRSGF